MNKTQLIIVFLILFYFVTQSEASDRLYVSDTFTITLRTGPSTENKIIRMLSSGQELEVMETGDQWSRVRTKMSDNTELEGWVRNQYLMDRTPYETRAKELLSENRKLKDRLSSLTEQQSSAEKDMEDISSQFDETRKELTSVRDAYETLKSESSEYLSLKAEYEANLRKIKDMEERLNELEIENASIKKSQSYIWFGTGALVLLFGLIIGSILGRQSRKRTSSYY